MLKELPKRVIKRTGEVKKERQEEVKKSPPAADVLPEKRNVMGARAVYAGNFHLAESIKPLKAKDGHSIGGISVGEMDAPPVGVALPSFCWEMFIGQTVFPFSAACVIGGAPGAYKSHFAMELAKWFIANGGFCQYLENENKLNEDMAFALLGSKLSQNCEIVACETFNEVQENLLARIKYVDKLPEPVPMLQIVDSVVGNAVEGSNKSLEKNGSIERGYPANALAAANFLPSYMPKLASKPYSGIWITHSKEVPNMTNSYLPPSIMFKGGQSWMYRTRLAIYITRVNEKPVAEGEYFVTKLRFSFLKDMSARGNKLPVSVYASNSVVEDVDGGVCARRIVKFDWDAATIDLFKDPDKYGYPETFAKIISETIGFKEAKKGTKNGYIAPNIGVNEPTTVPSEIVDALYAHPKELDLLRASLGIRKGIEILPDLPYKDAVKKSKEIAKKRSEAMLDGKTATVIKKGTLKS